ncbi:hypothetical protein [Polymorphospora rubra]|uniref:DNA (cytosine-5-)-methyltransferase n=1 Tax=Polymorphospora rubra TaxID=338584 RepID=A0A810N9I0_9ACTN|nr:hypothetical protein [Polymorphospora rubra]BCJ68025.1 hypothetical protein Prubr_50460 [Polymorphospora rubra]
MNERPTPQAGPRVGSVYSGYGGLDLAVELVLGGRLAWYAETDRHATTVLAYRWPGITNLGDIRTVDWTKVAPVDILAMPTRIRHQCTPRRDRLFLLQLDIFRPVCSTSQANGCGDEVLIAGRVYLA